MRGERLTMWLARVIGVVMLGVFASDMLTDHNLSATSRVLIMAVAAVTYLAVCIKQSQIAWKYEGAPVTWPLAFRWVVAQWFGVTGALITWFLLVALIDGLYTTIVSGVMWGIFAQSTLYFFARWISVGRPQIAGPGETGANS